MKNIGNTLIDKVALVTGGNSGIGEVIGVDRFGASPPRPGPEFARHDTPAAR